MRIDWSELFFSSSGRVARLPFIVAAAILVLVTAFYESLVTDALHWITGWVVYPLLIFAGAAVLSKRLHDRGRSGWWSLVILVAVVMTWPYPREIWDFIGLVVLIWAFVELALMPGEQGANRFGPNPQRPPENQRSGS